MVHVRVNSSAGDGVDLNMGGGQFFGEGFREGVDTALGGRVGSFAGGAADAPDGGDIDDMASLLLNHGRDGQLAAVKDRG